MIDAERRLVADFAHPFIKSRLQTGAPPCERCVRPWLETPYVASYFFDDCVHLRRRKNLCGPSCALFV
jgi:hypothetical protein